MISFNLAGLLITALRAPFRVRHMSLTHETFVRSDICLATQDGRPQSDRLPNDGFDTDGRQKRTVRHRPITVVKTSLLGNYCGLSCGPLHQARPYFQLHLSRLGKDDDSFMGT